jgi:Sulfotransferase family
VCPASFASPDTHEIVPLNSVTMEEGGRLFFIHIMKTGGTTFLYNLMAQFATHETYPDPAQDLDRVAAYTQVQSLLNLPAERTAVIRAYTGHFPYFVTQVLPGDFVTLTVLRDPIERTISYLKQCRGLEQFRAAPLEQIYDDPWQYAIAIENYQTRVFGMTANDEVGSIMDGIAIDHDRLALAKANLRAVDILGLNDHYEEFNAEVCLRFGWSTLPSPNRRVSEPEVIPKAFCRRIAEENAFDLEFYEFARELYAERNPRRHRH